MEDHHKKSAVLLMKTGGLLSMIACHFIMRDVLIRYHKGERTKLTQKIVFELSFSLFWGSFFSPFMSTWMVPEDSGAYQAAGNKASCTAQGFFDSLFYGLSVFMNAVLALTYCVIVSRGRRDETRSKRSLWMVLGAPPILCFLLAIKPLFNQAYNYTDFPVCGIAEHPLGCISDSSNDECTRGSHAREIKIARFALICLANTIIVVSVIVLIQHVIATERRMNVNSTQSSNDLSIKATRQGISYVAAFMFSWGPWYIWQWIRITSGMKALSSVLFYTISITYPLQGVCNAIVYFRPVYLKFRERDHEELRLASMMRALDITLPSILSIDWWRALRSTDDNDNASNVMMTTNECSHDTAEVTDVNNTAK